METAVGATAVDLQQRVNEAPIQHRHGPASSARTGCSPGVALQAARIYSATVEIHDEDGRRILREEPSVPDDALEQGLRRDTGIEPVTARGVRSPLPDGSTVVYFVTLTRPVHEPRRDAEPDPERPHRRRLPGPGGVARHRRRWPRGAWPSRSGACAASPGGSRPATSTSERSRPASSRSTSWRSSSTSWPISCPGTLSMLEADRDRLREFVADVSHELRTPIAALRMYTELQSNADVDDGTRREFLERSIEQIGRLEWLSTNLLDLSRIDAGIFPLDMRTGDLRDPVQAVVQALSEEALARGVSLESTVPQEPVELRFDRERIVQLMTNLVGNALKFTPRGGGASVQVDDGEGEVVITVRDTGPGNSRRRAAAHLRALLSRDEHRRRARIGQRAGAGDRPLDRRDARRLDRGRQRARQRDGVPDPPAPRPASRPQRSRTSRTRSTKLHAPDAPRATRAP